ncbi:WG repeat-containing protein [Budviciaceae bacterium BWR-B9]|uniref:WG repeat-containing protein n=2 Tax=Budviciaceae TaxID=1903416 RepID=A0ABS1IV55_9GAMM|nr:WG repeat-containing protein [Limnobaculum allomyrinae]
MEAELRQELSSKTDSDITVEGSFLMASRDSAHGRSYEIYRKSDKKLLFKGHFTELLVDGDNIITGSKVSSTDDRAYITIGNLRSSVYYDIYNTDGIKLNSEPYFILPAEIGFGKDGLMPVLDKQGRHYYIDRHAKKTNFDLSSYKVIESFSNGLAVVRGKNEKAGYINTQGKLVIPLMYEQAYYFQGGTAMVSTSDGTYQLITPDNQVVAMFTDTLVSYPGGKDSQEASYIFLRKKDGTAIAYNQKGEVISEKKSDE